jgi:hypothetical protein
MGYLPRNLLHKAYLTLSTLTEDHKQGQTQFTSALRHLLALDMYYKKEDDDCDLDYPENREAFTSNVKEIVNVEGDFYTTNFYTNIKELEDCGVGSNFYSAGVVNNSKQNTAYTYNYPTRGQYPLFKVKNNKLIRETAYYKNIKGYLPSQKLKCAFVIWVLRNQIVKKMDASTLKQKLQNLFTEELVEALMPKEEILNDYITGFDLDNNKIELTVNELLGLFSTKKETFGDNINPKYRHFITAIKSKPFLLLAGISGTGKSRIVRELARACWDADSEEFGSQKPRNFEMVQVKPNWHDSSELIGYVSRVSGEPVYVAGDFLKFVARAWEEPDVPYFLCLDEMNLAPVEQYFAEYLSVIESRKADEDGNITTDPILKKSGEQWYFDLTAQLTTDDDIRKRFNEEGISIPQSLIVVGTVNMDETTFSFSRKVLDRAMTIEMNEVDLEGGLTERYEQIGKLGKAELMGTAVEGVDVYASNKDVCDTAIDYLQKINEKLEGTPFKIAYRTRNEVLLYVVNNLPYNKIEGDDEQIWKEEYVIARALDEITNMKILSRIEGDETKVSKAFLEELSNVIKEELEEISDCSFDIEETDDAYKSVSLAKLGEMKKRLDSGYTSFWS